MLLSVVLSFAVFFVLTNNTIVKYSLFCLHRCLLSLHVIVHNMSNNTSKAPVTHIEIGFDGLLSKANINSSERGVIEVNKYLSLIIKNTDPFARALVVIMPDGALRVVDVGENGGTGLVDADEVIAAGSAVVDQSQRADLWVIRNTGRCSETLRA